MKQLYTSLIRLVILHDSVTWPLRKKKENQFSVFERKVLRRTCGPVKNNVTGEWVSRKNTELETLCNNLNVLEIISRERLRRAGHVCRNRNPLIRTVMEQNLIEKIQRMRCSKTICEMVGRRIKL